MSHIKFEYVWDESGSLPVSTQMTLPGSEHSLTHLVECFENFVKAIGFHIADESHLDFVAEAK